MTRSRRLGLVMFAASQFRPQLEAPLAGVSFAGLHAKEVTVLLVCLAGAAVYPVLLFALGGITPAELRTALRRRPGDAGGSTPDLP